MLLYGKICCLKRFKYKRCAFEAAGDNDYRGSLNVWWLIKHFRVIVLVDAFILKKLLFEDN